MLDKNSKIIVFFLGFLFVASSFWLFGSNQNQTDPEFDKKWWVLYFSDPKSQDLDFAIENHLEDREFLVEIFSGKEKIFEEKVFLQKKEGRDFPMDRLVSTEVRTKKITVRATGGDGDVREIYRSF